MNQAIDSASAFLSSLIHKYQWHDSIKELCIKGKPHEITWRTETVGENGEWVKKRIPTVEKQYALMQLPKEVDVRTEEFFAASVVPYRKFTQSHFIELTQQNMLLAPRKHKPQSGSTDFCCLAERLDDLASWRRFSVGLPDIKVPGVNRSLVIKDDFAISFFIVHFIMELNPDGGLPTKFVKELWGQLESDGHVTRAFSKNRWAAIRRFLGQNGFLNYQDRNYYVGYTNFDGEYIKGTAAKWGLDEWVVESFENIQNHSEQQDRACQNVQSSGSILFQKQQDQLGYNTFPKEVFSSTLKPDLIRNFLDERSEIHQYEQEVDKIIGHSVAIAA